MGLLPDDRNPLTSIDPVNHMAIVILGWSYRTAGSKSQSEPRMFLSVDYYLRRRMAGLLTRYSGSLKIKN